MARWARLASLGLLPRPLRRVHPSKQNTHVQVFVCYKTHTLMSFQSIKQTKQTCSRLFTLQNTNIHVLQNAAFEIDIDSWLKISTFSSLAFQLPVFVTLSCQEVSRICHRHRSWKLFNFFSCLLYVFQASLLYRSVVRTHAEATLFRYASVTSATSYACPRVGWCDAPW